MIKYQLVDTEVTDETGRLCNPRLVMGGKAFNTKEEAREFAKHLWGSMDGIQLIELEE